MGTLSQSLTVPLIIRNPSRLILFDHLICQFAHHKHNLTDRATKVAT